ncbi:MAG: thymidine phosphorylase [Clostridia bacterium]|nr:thymidine phosphorylase [Clostridia bacterium]
MNILDIIENKKVGKELSDEEIEYFVQNYTNGKITDYQAAALIMAICINGMTQDEILALTMSMANSGDILDLSDISENIVDKHSTGGVGDKITLIVAPIVAALGIPVAKMSGRGLGITGGTADKLESIPGYNINISIDEFKQNIKDIGISLITQTMNLAPADKKIYALRDTISCTNSMPLIASSIMSKKIAAGAGSIVLDVTCGSGAFMNTKEDAKKLAKLMALIGKLAKRETVCVLTDMNEPLGYSVGNTVEVVEAIHALKGNMAEDVKDVVLNMCIQMMNLSGLYPNALDNKYKVMEVIENGKAFEKFRELVIRQGGDVSYIDNPEKFEKAPIIMPVLSEEDGYVEELDAGKVGKAGLELGIGRKQKEDPIDYRVGLIFNKKIGDEVEKGDVLAYIHANSPEKAMECVERIKDAYKIGDRKITKKNIIEII